MTEAELPSADRREQALAARLATLGIVCRTYSHAPVFTVDEARALRGKISGVHTKNLFLKDRSSALWLIVVREELRVDLNAAARALGAQRFSFGAPELLIEVLGVPPGSVTPFALMNDIEGKVRVVLDAGMQESEPLNFHPLRNDRTTAISIDDFLRFLRATSHEPIVAQLPVKA